MIDKLFRKRGEKSLEIDYESLLQQTDEQFVGILQEWIGSKEITEMRLQGSRREKFVYLQVEKKWYSFAYDAKIRQLLFSRQLNAWKWAFVVGWRPAD